MRRPSVFSYMLPRNHLDNFIKSAKFTSTVISESHKLCGHGRIRGRKIEYTVSTTLAAIIVGQQHSLSTAATLPISFKTLQGLHILPKVMWICDCFRPISWCWFVILSFGCVHTSAYKFLHQFCETVNRKSPAKTVKIMRIAFFVPLVITCNLYKWIFLLKIFSIYLFVHDVFNMPLLWSFALHKTNSWKEKNIG